MLSKIFLMKTPCEIISTHFLPNIRSRLTIELIENFNFSQKQVSKKLGLTEAAVSQYISKKRGKEIKLDQKTEKAIKILAEKIAKGKIDDMTIIPEICNICLIMRKSGTICMFHKQFEKIPDSCNICLRG